MEGIVRRLSLFVAIGLLATTVAVPVKSIEIVKPFKDGKAVLYRRDEVPKGFPKPNSTRDGSTYLISKIKAVCNVGVAEQKAGFMDAEITQFFSVGEDTILPDMWDNITWFFNIKEISLDGFQIKWKMHDEYQNVFVIPEDVKLKAGNHQLKIKVRWDCNVPPAYWASANIWTYFGPDGFHLMNHWYFLPEDFAFTDVVDFDMDFSVPPDWFLCGSYVEPQYRDTPQRVGKYKFVSRTDSPFGYRIIGGAYEVYKMSYEDSNIRMYSFKDSKGDGPYIAQMGIDCLKFYSEYYNHKSKGDYFIAQIRCTRGQGFGCEGGFVIDAPYLTKANFMPEFMAHEMAHVSWWGGDGVCGTREQPHSRFMSEAFAEFSSFLFCEKIVSLGYYNAVIANEEYMFWKYAEGGIPLSSSASANSFPLTYYKGGLVIKCLKSWMGEEPFQKGMREVIDAYCLKDGQDPDNRPRCTQLDFKAIMERAYGKPLDDFWSVYFDSADIPVPTIDILKKKNEDGTTTDKLSFKYLGNRRLPVSVMVWFANGSSKQYDNPGGDNTYDLDGQVAGLENLSWGSLIHAKETTFHSMGTATIASILKWREPTVVCMNDEYMGKAQKWAKKLGKSVETSPPSYVKPLAVILVGPSAINTYGPKVISMLPAKQVGENYLEWYTLKIGGQFGMTTCSNDPDNYFPAYICDMDTGDIPDDLSWTAIFRRSDGCLDISYRSMANGALVPPKPEFQKLPWMDRTANLYDCRFGVNFEKPKGYQIAYDGFDPETFTLGKITKPADKLSANTQLILNLSKGSSRVSIFKETKYLKESWNQTQVYAGKGKYMAKPSGLDMGKCSKNQDYIVKWNDNQTYLYNLDGANSEKWESGSSLFLQNLPAETHYLKMVFISGDGLLFDIQETKFRLNSTLPKLEVKEKRLLWKSKTVSLSGTTDPDVILDPPGHINPDGSFTIDYQSDSCPKNLTIAATNECGFTTSKTIPVIRYIKFFLTLGKQTSEDYEGNSFALTVPAQAVKGSTYVPMRFIGERLGASIDWNAKEKKVTYVLGLTTVEIWIGKKTAKINGSPVEMPGSPVIVNGATLVPLRFVGSALGASISWDDKTKTATVEYPLP